MPLVEDQSEFFDQEDFATLATWTPSSSATSLQASVIYDGPDVTLWDGQAYSREHEIRYAAAQLPGLTEGELISVDLTYLGLGTQSFVVRTVTEIGDRSHKRASLGLSETETT